MDKRTIIGIDPGTRLLGFGVVDVIGGKPVFVDMGVLDLRKDTDAYAKLRQIYETVRMAQQLGLDALAVGKACGEVDKVARDYIDARFPGSFGHSLGHGVGLFIHEQPRVAANSETVLRPGHVVTVEPGVYIPGLGGCRIEDTVILTADGVINTIAAPKHLIEL